MIHASMPLHDIVISCCFRESRSRFIIMIIISSATVLAAPVEVLFQGNKSHFIIVK